MKWAGQRTGFLCPAAFFLWLFAGVMSAAGMASAGVRFFMLLAAMLAAFMMRPMMAALHGGVICERAVEQSRNRIIRIACCAAIKPDSAFLKCTLCTRADSAADQRVHLKLFQDVRKRPMAAAVCVNNSSNADPAAFHIIHLEAFRVAKVLENFPVS